MKIIRRIIILVVLLLILGGVALYLSVDRIIKTTVQSQATSSLNLNTTLDSASLALLGGNLKLTGLSVASPPGFSTTSPMFQLGQAAMTVNYGQLRTEPIHVANITLTNPALLVEYANKQINLNAAVDQMPKSSEESTSTPGGSGSASSDNSSKPIKLIIDTLTVTGATVTLHPGSDFPSMGTELTIPLPDLTLKNIGTGTGNQDGAAIKDVVTQVTAAMWKSALTSGKIQGEFQQMAMSKFQDMAKSLPGGVGSAIGDITSNPKNVVNDLMGKNGNSPTSQPGGQVGNLLKGFEKK